MNRILALLVMCICILTGCGEKEETPEVSVPVARAAYIINGNAQTISVFDIEKSEVRNDVLPVGKYPADIKIRGDRAYVVNSGDNSIQIIDLASLKQVGMINTGDGTSPERIGFVTDRKAYVSCLTTNSAKVIDMISQQAAKNIPVGVWPQGVAVSKQKVYVCNTAYDLASKSYGKGTVSVIDSSTDTVIKTINVETNPTEAAISNGMVVILCTGNYGDIVGKLVIIDPATDSVAKTIDLGATPSGVAISPKGIAYVTSFGGLLSADTGSGSMIHTAAAPLSDFAGGAGLAIDKDGNGYICVPDWTPAGKDKLLVMDASEKLVGTHKLSGGASIIALRE